MKIALTNPKYARNVGGAIRACSCWGVDELIWSGNRVLSPEEWDSEERIPREMRMFDVKLTRSDRFKDIIKSSGLIPIAIEFMDNSENLFDFIHPENAMYIFGPEDGSIPSTILQHCHRFVKLPTIHCLNLTSAINCVLMHRMEQIYKNGCNSR